jgi:hypothetical protein
VRHAYRNWAFLGGALAQDTNGTQAQATFHKGAALHDVLYKRRKSTQTDCRERGDVLSVLTTSQRGGQRLEVEPACCTQALMNAAHQVVYEISTSAQCGVLLDHREAITTLAHGMWSLHEEDEREAIVYVTVDDSL